MSSTKRVSLAPAGPKPPVNLASNALIGEHVTMIGTFPIKVGENTVIHPRAKLNSSYGPIAIGAGCIIGERCGIGLTEDLGDLHVNGRGVAPDVVVENGCMVEVGAIVEGCLGEGCVIEVGAHVHRGAVLGKVGPLCQVAVNERLADHMVVYGSGDTRLDRSLQGDLGTKVLEAKHTLVAKQLQVLRKLVVPTNVAKYQ